MPDLGTPDPAGRRPTLPWVIQKLSVEDIKRVLASTPEQHVFDWKRTFEPPRDEQAKGEFVKDLMAVANGVAFSPRSVGYVFYGVNPAAPDPVVGIKASWDDADAQALAKSVLAPVPEFLYYEIEAGKGRSLGVLHVAWRGGFFVVSRDIGKLREGQSMIRQGSKTRGVTQQDQLRLYLTPGYGYAEQLLARHGVVAQLMNAQTAQLQQLESSAQRIRRDMDELGGL